jgi:hypothetical protein
MATRTIVTAQPDVMCDVCERRLLRGEQPDVFIAAGRRRIVCELCAPRAAHEGWLRERDSQSLSLPPARARRGRSLLDRLPARARKGMPAWVRQLARPGQETSDELLDADDGRVIRDNADATATKPRRSGRSPATAGAQPYDAFAEELIGEPQGEPPASAYDPEDAPAAIADGLEAQRSETASVDQDGAYLQDAITVFNASEFPRRVAGVARSLGAPSVSVRCAEHLSSVVSVVVAWELCWYRYQVDLSEPVVEAQLVAQGTELAELEREERTANAAAADSGSLALSVL